MSLILLWAIPMHLWTSVRSRLLTVLFLILSAALPLAAHVGSPDVFYEGDAGPYHLFVVVRMPQVIPGVATIEVRSTSPDVQAIRVVPLRLTGQGSKFPPTPDLAEPSKDDPQLFTANLWLMEFGALQVRILADGAKGQAELSVPVPSFAQRSMPMAKPLRWLLVTLTALLAASIVAIVGAGVREGKLDRGQVPASSNVRRGRIVMAITAVAVLAVLYLGKSWWGAEASAYQRTINVFEPPLAEAKLENGHRLILRAQGRDPGWSRYARMDEVIPDHGHFMHLFLVRAPELDRFSHLHPEPIAGGTFAQELPAMCAGHYQIFADVVSQAGYPWTLVGSIDLPEINTRPPTGDDSTWAGAPLGTAASADEDPQISQLTDGCRMVWQRPTAPLKAHVALSFKFLVEDKTGNPVRDLEPYMGMAGHAEFVRSDLSVFAHVHPAGSVSMAALELLQSGLTGSFSAAHASMPMSATTMPSEVSFPYGFPQPGTYRIFVQIKRFGHVQTGTFDARVR